MSGYIAEFFGYAADDVSKKSLETAAKQICPFLGTICAKILSRDHIISGVCAVKQKAADAPCVICCPNRIYAENYKMLMKGTKEDVNKWKNTMLTVWKPNLVKISILP